MNQWWQYWSGYFGPMECDKLIEIAQRFPAVDGKIGHATDKVINDVSVRRSKLRWLPRYDPTLFSFFGRLELLFQEANCNAFGFDLTMFREVQYTEYHAADAGTYDWHHDTTWTSRKLQRRKLSLVVQLSDPSTYEGGRFEMSKADCDEVPNSEKLLPRGTVIIFPSFLRHRVTPVTLGSRLSLVTWYEGPYFR